ETFLPGHGNARSHERRQRGNPPQVQRAGDADDGDRSQDGEPNPVPSDGRVVEATAELRRDVLQARQETHLGDEQRLRQVAAALETDLFALVEPLGLAELGVRPEACPAAGRLDLQALPHESDGGRVPNRRLAVEIVRLPLVLHGGTPAARRRAVRHQPRSKPVSRNPASPSPVAEANCACCWMLSRSSGPSSERNRNAKWMFLTRTHGHAMPSVQIRRSALTRYRARRATPVTGERKRAAPYLVWSQKKRRLRARYQIQQIPRVGSVRSRERTNPRNSSHPLPSKSKW